ncbi:hypothetical protein [Agrobacterium sp. RS6]
MNIFPQPAALFLAQAARFLPGPSCRALLLLPAGATHVSSPSSCAARSTD